MVSQFLKSARAVLLRKRSIWVGSKISKRTGLAETLIFDLDPVRSGALCLTPKVEKSFSTVLEAGNWSGCTPALE